MELPVLNNSLFVLLLYNIGPCWAVNNPLWKVITLDNPMVMCLKIIKTQLGWWGFESWPCHTKGTQYYGDRIGGLLDSTNQYNHILKVPEYFNTKVIKSIFKSSQVNWTVDPCCGYIGKRTCIHPLTFSCDHCLYNRFQQFEWTNICKEKGEMGIL